MRKHLVCVSAAAVITMLAWGMLAGGLMTVSAWNLTPTPRAPLTASDYVARGKDYLEQGDYEQAIAAFSEAIRLDPGSAVAYNNRGYAYDGQREYERAIADYDEAIRLDPGSAVAYNNRGNAYYNKGECARAIEDLDEAIRLDPDYAVAHNSRGSFYAGQGEYARAIADYDEAIRLDPDYADAYNNRGYAYDGQGEYEQAIADYNEAIRLNPGNSEAYGNRGTAYYAQGDYTRAIADFDEAIRLDPSNTLAYYNRGSSYAIQGDYERAIADFNEAIRLDPDHAYAYNNRGYVYAMQGEYARAIADFDEAIRLESDFAEAYLGRGQAYHIQGEYDLALADLHEYVRLVGENADPVALDLIEQIEASAQTEPQNDPFWSLLAMVPDYDGSRAQLSYLNLQAVASIGDAADVTLTDVREKTNAGNRWWEAIGMTQGPLSYPMFSVVRTAMFESQNVPGMETLLGFTYLDVQQAMFFRGTPPDEGQILAGNFDLDAMQNALTARDFEAQEIGGVRVWCWVEGCDQGYRQDLTNLQPGNIFGGVLGRREPLVMQQQVLLASPLLPTITMMIGAQQVLQPVLADAPEYRTFTEAATAQGTVVQAVMMDADAIRDMEGEDVLREWNLIDIALPEQVKERAVACAKEFGVLPRYHLFGFAQTWQDGEQVTHLIVVYDNVETAEVAANELYHRLTGATSLHSRMVEYYYDMLTEYGEVLPASVYEGEHGAAAIFSVRATPENANDLAALARPFLEFGYMISNRDLYFMGTEFVLPE